MTGRSLVGADRGDKHTDNHFDIDSGVCATNPPSFLEWEAGAVALASRAQAMSRNVGLSRRRRDKEQIARYFVQLACRAIECIRHQPNSVLDVVQTHTQVRGAEFFLQGWWRNMQGRTGKVWWPHMSSAEVTRALRNRQRVQRRKEMWTAQSFPSFCCATCAARQNT